MTEAVEGVAMVEAAAGRGARAARLLGAAAAVREAIGAPMPPHQREDFEAAVTPVRAAMGEEAWTEAFATGRTLSLLDAIADALDSGHTPQ